MQVVTLPEGEDPDTFVRTHGARGLEAQLATSIDVFERKIQILDRGGWFADLRRKRQALDRLLPTLRATSDPLTRDMYLGHASAAAGVSREMLERELAMRRAAPLGERAVAGAPVAPLQDASPASSADSRHRADVATVVPPMTSGARCRRAAIGAERELVRVLLHRAGILRAGRRARRRGQLSRSRAAARSSPRWSKHGADAGVDALADRLDPDCVEATAGAAGGARAGSSTPTRP